MATTKDNYKTERCKVLRFSADENALDIDFQGYGIRIANVKECKTEFVLIKYKGEIGTNNFQHKLG